MGSMFQWCSLNKYWLSGDNNSEIPTNNKQDTLEMKLSMKICQRGGPGRTKTENFRHLIPCSLVVTVGLVVGRLPKVDFSS